MRKRVHMCTSWKKKPHTQGQPLDKLIKSYNVCIFIVRFPMWNKYEYIETVLTTVVEILSVLMHVSMYVWACTINFQNKYFYILQYT